MIKNLIIPLFYCLLPLLGPKQSKAQDSKIEPLSKNQIDIDIQFLGVDFLYKRSLNKKIYAGGGIGIGGFASIGTQGTYAEIMRGKILFDYVLNNNFHIYQSSTFSLLTYDSKRDSYFQTLKLGLGIFYRISKLEIGIEPSVIFSEENSGQLITSLLIIKIPLKRW